MGRGGVENGEERSSDACVTAAVLASVLGTLPGHGTGCTLEAFMTVVAVLFMNAGGGGGALPLARPGP